MFRGHQKKVPGLRNNVNSNIDNTELHYREIHNCNNEPFFILNAHAQSKLPISNNANSSNDSEWNNQGGH